MLETLNLLSKYNGSLPLIIGKKTLQSDSTMHKHNSVELVIITDGNAQHIVNDGICDIQKGNIFVIKKGLAHQYLRCSKDFSLININFDPEKMLIWHLDLVELNNYKEILYGEFTESNSYPFLSLDKKTFANILSLATTLYKENRKIIVCKKFHIFYLFMNLMSTLIKVYSQNNKKSHKSHDDISDVIYYINQHFREEITIIKLCKISHMSKANLMNKFHKITGTSIIQYQLQLRIAEATHLLKLTNRNIKDIAYEIGFKDVNYFGRQFKKITNYSPLKYRKSI